MNRSTLHVGLVCRNDVDSCIDLAISLQEAGANVTLYLSKDHAASVAGSPDRPVERLYESGVLPKECRVRLRKIPRMRDPRSFFTVFGLAKTIRNDQIELAHILIGPGEIWLAVLSALLGRVPVISTIVVPKPNEGEVLPNWVVYATHRILAHYSEIVVVNGKDQVELVERLYGIPRERVVHVPLCPRTSAVRWPRGENGDAHGTILFFGEARLHKGLEYLIQAQPLITKYAPKATILIASRGAELDRCRKLIADASRFEIHEGFFSGDVMADYFSRASVVVLPYITASTSGILMTAYVFGKPVVVSDVGSLPEYVEHGATGFLVPPKDERQLAEAIVRLLLDDNLRHNMGVNAKKWVNEMQQQVATHLINAYRKAIAGHSSIWDVSPNSRTK